VLAGLVLSYNYQGNNIDQLTSPFAPTKFLTFSKILANNFTIYSLPTRYEFFKSTLPNTDEDPEMFYRFNWRYWNVYEATFGRMYLYQKSRNTTYYAAADSNAFLKSSSQLFGDEKYAPVKLLRGCYI